MPTDEYGYRILKLLEANPQASQRDIARELRVSLGKVNYCLKALIERGWVKANYFRHNEQKRAYLYLLTPKGIEAKAKVTIRFLKRNLGECESLKRERAELQLDAVLMHHSWYGQFIRQMASDPLAVCSFLQTPLFPRDPAA